MLHITKWNLMIFLFLVNLAWLLFAYMSDTKRLHFVLCKRHFRPRLLLRVFFLPNLYPRYTESYSACCYSAFRMSWLLVLHNYDALYFLSACVWLNKRSEMKSTHLVFVDDIENHPIVLLSYDCLILYCNWIASDWSYHKDVLLGKRPRSGVADDI